MRDKNDKETWKYLYDWHVWLCLIVICDVINLIDKIRCTWLTRMYEHEIDGVMTVLCDTK